jgi:hypothetical protein
MRTLVCLHLKALPKYELILATIKDYHDSNNINLQTLITPIIGRIYGKSHSSFSFNGAAVRSNITSFKWDSNVRAHMRLQMSVSGCVMRL